MTDPQAAPRETIPLPAEAPRAMPAAAAIAAGVAGVVVALHHPFGPAIALAALVAWTAAAMRWPRAWLVVLPAALPAASLAPWTGWIVFDEFDLVVLGAAIAGFATLARGRDRSHPATAATDLDPPWRWWLLSPWLCAVTAIGALVHGLAAGGFASIGWFDAHADPLNAWRVAKGALYALLLAPLLQHELGSASDAALRRIATGMLAGIAIVAVAVVVERSGDPGLFDFSQPYRTTAWFWEMHVGGAAIDGYLALAWPFVAWAVLGSRTVPRWALSATLALLVGYACLTTFSRGLYLGLLGGMVALFLALRRRPAAPPPPAWRPRADLMLAAALLMQVAAVIGSESFMRARVHEAESDFAKRLIHWQRGLRVLTDAPDWALGKGSGRLPAEYALRVPEDELPGSARVIVDGTETKLLLEGPARSQAFAGRYALTQRVPLEPAAYRVAFDAQVDRPVRLGFSVCAMHLLYERACQRAEATLVPRDASRQRVTLTLVGPRLPGELRSLRTAVFAVAVLDAGARVRLDRIRLGDDRDADLLRNGDFSHGLAHWFPLARGYFVPWHIDNFYLEVLIEQGIAGLAAVVLLLATALKLSARAGGPKIAPYLSASLVSALLVGTVSSLMDMPRVAFLLFFLALLPVQLVAARSR